MKINFLESDLENIIEESNPQDLIDRGLDCLFPGCSFIRQLKIGNYGIIDLLAYHVHYEKKSDQFFHYLNILELKQNEINMQSLLQLARYMRGMSTMFSERGYNITGTLIGKTVESKSDFIHVAEKLMDIQIYEYSFNLNGFQFSEIDASDFNLVDKGNILSPKELISKHFTDSRNLAIQQFADEIEPEKIESEESRINIPIDDLPF